MEKQYTFEVKQTNKARGYGECPKYKTVVGCSNKYCRECGQRLE